MHEIEELIKKYGLEDDMEHVIIPVTNSQGKKKRIFLIKRKFIRVMDKEGHFADYHLQDAIEATVKHPEMPLSVSLKLLESKPTEN
ncbi:MAG: hypothetical protein HQL10_03670 [Nitrospirae bacterium]|nr:hypothetical protein [Nitrospirota bacterium]